MRNLFNDGWVFAELPLDESSMYENGKPILFCPDQFFELADSQKYNSVNLPHDWQIYHVKDLYRSSVGFYKKTLTLQEEPDARYMALDFEGVYMNWALWVNGKKAGECKYGYSALEIDISKFVHSGKNELLVIAVYQNCNTRWYSGAGIFRDVHLINSPEIHLLSDGVYFSAKPVDPQKLEGEWKVIISSEVASGKALRQAQGPQVQGAQIQGPYVSHTIIDLTGKQFAAFDGDGQYTVKSPELWDINNPHFYILKTRLFDASGNLLDELEQHCGFKHAVFTSDKGFFLNGKHVKINGACQHHDLGALGSAFNEAALRRQFTKLKEMGVNAVRCSHNPPPAAWMNLCDQMGILVDDEAFDMWEKPKTPFDYGNYFNDCCERDTASWVRRDRNHPSLIMWSIGNEIYDTHVGNGFEITKRLSKFVRQHDPLGNAPITIASNYMMTDGAQKCAGQIDTVGYNYLERLYDEHHAKYPDWKIYGSETSSTVQSRGIYHFPDSLKLVTFSDGQCSTLGNCTTPWGAVNTQYVITTDRDCPFSAGQFIWTGWDYIGEPTPYHTKSSFFGQIDTAGFPKDTYYLYKSEWAGKSASPFVHLLPYWDWNEGQLIDVKAYTNADRVELFVNGKSAGLQEIDHEKGKTPFAHWQVEYHKGEIRALAYDADGKVLAEDVKKSFDDPAEILLQPEENYNVVPELVEGPSEAIHFIQIMLADHNGTLVENARNYITINVSGNAELVGMDNGDSTDYDEYVSVDGHIHTRKLFANRLIAIVRKKAAGAAGSDFVVTAASQGLPNVSIKYDGKEWSRVEADTSVLPQNAYVPVRKIELQAQGALKLDPSNKEVLVTAKVLPLNATDKEINWNPVFKECIASDNIVVEEIPGSSPRMTDVASPRMTGDAPMSLSGLTRQSLIRAAGDGECLLRCTAQNNTKYDEVISDLPFTITGIGSTRLNPYTLIEACRFTDFDSSNGKEKPEMSLESGISNRKCGPTWVSFDKVDFGKDGADTIHLPIFSFATEFPIQVWDGKGTGPDSINLGTYTYKHESIYNTYSENIFTLPRRLFGVHTITLSFGTDLYLHGFYFDKTPKAYSKLCVLDANLITGDSFTKTSDAVEGIGNNVNIDFEDMDFGNDQTKDHTNLTICGRSNSENNTINLKFFTPDGSSKTYVIDFAHTDVYEEKTFQLPVISGLQKVSFVFLPGCNFDFKWFRFEK